MKKKTVYSTYKMRRVSKGRFDAAHAAYIAKQGYVVSFTEFMDVVSYNVGTLNLK